MITSDREHRLPLTIKISYKKKVSLTITLRVYFCLVQYVGVVCGGCIFFLHTIYNASGEINHSSFPIYKDIIFFFSGYFYCDDTILVESVYYLIKNERNSAAANNNSRKFDLEKHFQNL